MAFIKEKDREKQIKKINKKYGFRKFLLLVEIIGLVAFFAVYVLNELGYLNGGTPFKYLVDKQLTPFGWAMFISAAILIILGIVSVVFIFTFEDPYKVKNRVSKLQSSAIGGKKINKSESHSKQVKERMKSQKTGK